MSNESGLSAVATAALGADAVAKKDHDAAVAKAKADGVTEGKAVGATEAKARIKAITGSEHAKDRETLAAHLAYDTDMSAESAIATLQAAPKAVAAPIATAPVAPLKAAGEAPNPSVDANANGGNKPLDDFSAGQALVAGLKAK